MEPVDLTVNVNVNVVLDAVSVAAASVEPLADTIKKLPYLAHCQSDRAHGLEGLRKERQQYTP
jgi:hypothetical protein